MRTVLRFPSVILILALLILVQGTAGCTEQAPKEEEKERTVRTRVVALEEQREVIRYLGTVTPATSWNLAFALGGRVESIPVQKDQEVSAGQMLARLDPTGQELNLDLAKQQIRQAETGLQKATEAAEFYRDQLERLKRLEGEGAVAARQVDEMALKLDLALGDVRQAQAALEQARLNRSLASEGAGETSLQADTDAVVAAILVEEGEITGAGVPVLVLHSRSRMIRLGVNAADAARIQPGSPAVLVTGSSRMEGKVLNVSSLPDPVTRTYMVEVADPGTGLMLGETCQVELDTGTLSGIWLSVSEILQDGQDYVFVVRQDRVVRQNLTLKEISGSLVRVEGLRPGDEIVVEGHSTLTEGARIVREEDPS